MKKIMLFLAGLFFLGNPLFIVAQCDAGDLITKGEIIVCPEDLFDLETINEMYPSEGGFGWLFLNDSTAYGAFNSPFIVNADPSTKYNSDLNGLLTALDLPKLYGVWTVKAASYSIQGSAFSTICNVSTDSLLINFNHPYSANIFNSDNEFLTVNVFGGTEPYAYNWSNGDTTQVTSNLMDGTMSVTVTDAFGCEIELETELMNTAVEDIEGLSHFSIGPNPTNGITAISLSLEASKNIKMELFSLDGKRIKCIVDRRSRGGNYRIDLSNNEAGMYLIKVEVGNAYFVQRVFKH